MDDPEMQAAALEGLASNLIAQTYTEGEATPETRSRLLAARDAALISGTDPGSLAFIVRDLMDAAGYEYDPERPLADQSRECCDLIRTTTSEWHLALLAMSNDNQRHEAEEQRLNDLVDELRKHVEAKDHFIDKAVTQLADARRERDHARKQLGDAQANWVRAANRYGQPESGEETAP